MLLYIYNLEKIHSKNVIKIYLVYLIKVKLLTTYPSGYLYFLGRSPPLFYPDLAFLGLVIVEDLSNFKDLDFFSL